MSEEFCDQEKFKVNVNISLLLVIINYDLCNTITMQCMHIVSS